MGCLNHQQYFATRRWFPPGFHLSPVFLTIPAVQPCQDPSYKSRCKMGTLCKKANARATALLHCTICKRFGCQLSHSCCTWKQSQQQKNRRSNFRKLPKPNSLCNFFQVFLGSRIYLPKKQTAGKKRLLSPLGFRHPKGKLLVSQPSHLAGAFPVSFRESN